MKIEWNGDVPASINGTPPQLVQSNDFGPLVRHPAVNGGIPTPVGNLKGRVQAGKNRGPDGKLVTPAEAHNKYIERPTRGRRPTYNPAGVAEARRLYYKLGRPFEECRARLGVSRTTARELLTGKRCGYA